MSGSLTIRDAEPGDARRIAAIHVASWQAAYRGSLPDSYLDSLTTDQRLPMWKRLLGSPTPTVNVWVAQIEDEIVGFCSVGPPEAPTNEATEPLMLHTIYLRPDCVRRGVGSALLEHAEREMARMGATVAILWVLSENQPARRFYEASGWTPDGTEKQDELWGQTVREVLYRKRLALDTFS